jgi:hypothetical protein
MDLKQKIKDEYARKIKDIKDQIRLFKCWVAKSNGNEHQIKHYTESIALCEEMMKYENEEYIKKLKLFEA